MVEWHGFRFVAVSAALVCSPVAAAQAAPRPESTPPEISHSVGDGDVAQQRMKSGDCDAAIDGFDRALRTRQNPEMRRDRGTCHEKLAHPYPAIDDYRAYLTARPNAPDSDAIRARLEALEAQVGIVKPHAVDAQGKSAGADLEISLSTAGESESASSAGPATTASGKNLDTAEKSEQLEMQADSSPLRKGTGFIVGLAIDPALYGKSEFGWSETVGLDLRYALTRVSTMFVELNFEHVNTDGTASSLGGPGVVGGYEARLALNPRVTDAILLGGMFGYEHLSQGATGLAFSMVQPKARLGYRHVFGPTFGLEAGLDGGLALIHLAGGVGNASSDTSTAIVGLHMAAVLGF